MSSKNKEIKYCTKNSKFYTIIKQVEKISKF